MFGRTARALVLSAAGFAVFAGGLPAAAQDAETTARVKKLEAEVRALQRKVFPGDDGKYFEPEITGSATTAKPLTPSTTALTDVLARLDALETQLQRLTAQYEEGANAMRLLQDRVGLLEKAGAPASAAPAELVATATQPATRPADEVKPVPVAAATPKPVAAKPSGPNPARLAAVQAILKPQSADAGDDEYSYGFRLWDAKFYPEAQQQLTLFLDKYPRHARVSFARNLLGRAYLDDGKAKEAAPWFLKNYQADKAGERAGDSLLYLAEAMIALKDTKRACIALAEFSDSYPALAAGRLMSQYEANRAKIKC